MPERSFEEFLSALDRKVAEHEEDERSLLAPPEPLKASGEATVANIASGLRRQVRNAATTRLTTASSAERPRFCRHCGAALKPEGRFCTKCGKPIEAGA